MSMYCGVTSDPDEEWMIGDERGESEASEMRSRMRLKYSRTLEKVRLPTGEGIKGREREGGRRGREEREREKEREERGERREGKSTKNKQKTNKKQTKNRH